MSTIQDKVIKIFLFEHKSTREHDNVTKVISYKSKQVKI